MLLWLTCMAFITKSEGSSCSILMALYGVWAEIGEHSEDGEIVVFVSGWDFLK